MKRKAAKLFQQALDEHDLRTHFRDISIEISEKHLRFYHWPSTNVGDLVTPYLLDKTGVPGSLSQSISEADINKIESTDEGWWSRLFRTKRSTMKRAKYIVSTGSVVRLCGDHALVFGSGVRSVDQDTCDAIIRFVRGPLTRERFLANGTVCPPIYGDPGLLLPRFYSPTIELTDQLAVIPHFTEYSDIFDIYKDEPRVKVVDMGSGNLEQCIDEIVSCRASVSSSLHGLVFSHAYGVPTRHVILSDKVFGDGTKYRDHYR